MHSLHFLSIFCPLHQWRAHISTYLLLTDKTQTNKKVKLTSIWYKRTEMSWNFQCVDNSSFCPSFPVFPELAYRSNHVQFLNSCNSVLWVGLQMYIKRFSNLPTSDSKTTLYAVACLWSCHWAQRLVMRTWYASRSVTPRYTEN